MLAATVGEFDLAGLVVVGTPLLRSKQERTRRICLERLLHELDQLGVEQVYTEARTPRLNKRDRLMVDVLRIQRVIGPGIRVDTSRPLDEPRLWVPDIVAGAVTASRGGNDAWLAPMKGALTEIQVTLR